MCVCVRSIVCGCDLEVEATCEVASPGAAVSTRGFYLCTYKIHILSRCNTLKQVYVVTLHHTTQPFDNTLHNTAKYCNTLHHPTTYCTTLQCKATRCNTVHHPVTHTQTQPNTCDLYQSTALPLIRDSAMGSRSESSKLCDTANGIASARDSTTFCTHMYIFIHEYVLKMCTSTYLYVYIHERVYFIHIYIIYMNTHMQVYVYRRAYVYTYTCIYIRVSIYTYICIFHNVCKYL